MVIYLKHPQHGTKVACDEAEASYDIGNGWTRCTPESPVPVAVEPVIRGSDNATDGDGDSAPIVGGGAAKSGEETLEDLRARYQEKFGKKAHHKKSIEALKKELAA